MVKQKFIASKIVYGFLGLVLLLSLWFFLRPQPLEVETAKIQRGDFEEYLRIDGVIKAKRN